VSRTGRLVAAVVIATGLTCGAGIAARMVRCGKPCVSDLPFLYQHRGIRPDALPYVDRNLEYPVLVGEVFWLTTFVAHDTTAFFLATAIAATALAMLTAGLLARRFGRRAWYFALAPPLALYAPMNWDAFAVLPAVAGLLAFDAGFDVGAGALLGVGAALKLYPALFLAPLAVARVRAGRTRDAVRLVVAAVGVLLAVNLPVFVASPHGWSFPLRFQSRRLATWGSLWHYLLHLPGRHPWFADGTARSIANMGALLALGAGVALVCVSVWRGRLGAIGGAAVVTALFLLTNKVYSPQYDLWLVPFFVMLAVPWRDYAAFVLADAAVFTFVFAALDHEFRVTPAWGWLLGALVVARALVIALVVRGGRRSGTALDRRPVSPRAAAGPVALGRAT
jgi:uncharacterized membrane protein